MNNPVKYALTLLASVAALSLAACKQEAAREAPQVDAVPDVSNEPVSKVAIAPVESRAPDGSVVRTHYFQCGDKLVQFTLGADDAAGMSIANVSYAMKQVVTASGAKYENLGDPTTYLWNKGDKATISIDGQDLPECQEVPAPKPERRVGGDPIRDRTWVLVRINDAEPIAGYTVTLTLAADGGVSGRGGCNRYMGQYSVNGDVLSINENMASTMMACAADGVMAQESRYLKVLAAMNKMTRAEDGTLHLVGADHQSLIFREE